MNDNIRHVGRIYTLY